MPDLVPTDTRLSKLEEALRIDERVESLERSLLQKSPATQKLPWWRNSRTITILAAMITALLPLLTFIDGSLKNSREAQRLLAEQQDKIRQNYLDRVLKPGITEGEQKRLFSLLAKLKSDPEFQQWAQDELTAATQKVAELVKEKAQIEAEKQQILTELTDLGIQFDKNVPTENVKQIKPDPKVQKLQTDLAESQQRVAAIQQRVGEPQTNEYSRYIVTFLTEPPGAKVTLIQMTGPAPPMINKGTTPFKTLLNWGTYKATFESEGKQTVSRFIVVNRDDEISVDLKDQN